MSKKKVKPKPKKVDKNDLSPEELAELEALKKQLKKANDNF